MCQLTFYDSDKRLLAIYLLINGNWCHYNIVYIIIMPLSSVEAGYNLL